MTVGTGGPADESRAITTPITVDCAQAEALPGTGETARLIAAERAGPVVARGALVAGAVMVVDQLTKAGATALGTTSVTHPVANAEFSLGLAGGSLPVMVMVTIAGIVAFGAYVVSQAVLGRLPAWVPGLLLGGALSNLADRVLFGAVRDFVPTPWVLWNLADLAVFVGIGGYAWGHLRRRQPTSHHCEEEVIPT